MRVGLSHDPLRFYLSFYDVSFKKAFSNERFLGFFQTTLHSGFCFDLYFATFLPPPSLPRLPSLHIQFQENSFSFFFSFFFFFFFSFLLFFFSSFLLSSFLLIHVHAQKNFFLGFGKFFFSLHAQKKFFLGFGKFFSVCTHRKIFFQALENFFQLGLEKILFLGTEKIFFQALEIFF